MEHETDGQIGAKTIENETEVSISLKDLNLQRYDLFVRAIQLALRKLKVSNVTVNSIGAKNGYFSFKVCKK